MVGATEWHVYGQRTLPRTVGAVALSRTHMHYTYLHLSYRRPSHPALQPAGTQNKRAVSNSFQM